MQRSQMLTTHQVVLLRAQVVYNGLAFGEDPAGQKPWAQRPMSDATDVHQKSGGAYVPDEHV
jgi:hypothetical protein